MPGQYETEGRRDSAAHYDLIARGGGAERARTALDQAGLLPSESR